MDQKIVNMIEDCGIEASDVEHIIKAVEHQAKSHAINEITDSMLTEFDKGIDSEKDGRAGAHQALLGQRGNVWHYHDGRVDGVDTGRYIAEKVLNDIKESHDAKLNGKGYIATAEIEEEEIGYFGEGSTPAEALKWFDVNEYISSSCFENGDVVEIGVFRAIYKGSEEWKKGDYREDFKWVLGERVDTKMITVNLDEPERE